MIEYIYDDDWCGVYVDGSLYHEGRPLSTGEKTTWNEYQTNRAYFEEIEE